VGVLDEGPGKNLLGAPGQVSALSGLGSRTRSQQEEASLHREGLGQGRLQREGVIGPLKPRVEVRAGALSSGRLPRGEAEGSLRQRRVGGRGLAEAGPSVVEERPRAFSLQLVQRSRAFPG
jgi:hypothetical protein